MVPSGELERVGIVFLMGLAGCLAVGRPAIRQLQRLGWIQPTRYDDCPPLQPVQQAKQGTPTMGGLFVLGIAGLAAALAGGLRDRAGWIVLGAMMVMGAVGVLDDWLKLRTPNAKGLRCWPKLVVALGIGGVIGVLLADPISGRGRLLMPWLAQTWDVSLIWWVPLAMGVVAGTSHAVNLTDGMDGLAAGCLAIAFGTLGVIAAIHPIVRAGAGGQIAPIWCAALAGASVGFVWFNGTPAMVFLGDVGALGLGAALGTLALLSGAALGLLLIGGVFVAEAMSVLLQVTSYRWRNKRRIFRVAPLHHHVQLGGLSEPTVVIRFWIVGLLMAVVGVMALHPS